MAWPLAHRKVNITSGSAMLLAKDVCKSEEVCDGFLGVNVSATGMFQHTLCYLGNMGWGGGGGAEDVMQRPNAWSDSATHVTVLT